LSARGVEQDADFIARVDAKALRETVPDGRAGYPAGATVASGAPADGTPPVPPATVFAISGGRPSPSPDQAEHADRDRYGTARGVAGFLSAVGWLEVAGGAVVALISLGMMRELGPFGLLGLVPGIMLAAFGLLQVASGQMAQATIDSANHTGEMLEI